MVKHRDVYKLMFCYSAGLDVYCGFLDDKFYMNQTYGCSFEAKDGHIVIGKRTSKYQILYFEKYGEFPRKIRRCLVRFEDVDQPDSSGFTECPYADYDTVSDKENSCRLHKSQVFNNSIFSTFDGRTFCYERNSTSYFPGKAFDNEKIHDNYGIHDYVFVLDVDAIKIETIIPRPFGVVYRDQPSCSVEFYQIPSQKVFTAVNTPCLPKTDYKYFYFNETKINDVGRGELHACAYEPNEHKMTCAIIAKKILKIEFNEIGVCNETDAGGIINHTMVDDGNFTNIGFSAFTGANLTNYFVFKGRNGGFKHYLSGSIPKCTDSRDSSKLFFSDPGNSIDDVFTGSSTNFDRNDPEFIQYVNLMGMKIIKLANGSFIWQSNRTYDSTKDLYEDLKYDYIFVDDYTKRKIYFPPKPTFFCFRVTFNLVMATLAVDGFLALLFMLIFVMEIIGYRKKSYHDVRLELMLQKFAILKAAGRC
uniref:Uncharacterized protein n=1 Tax=Panagrolaimus sp. JU765 TaxID=591449 RepID=A0AC34RTL3_9BILA